MNEELPQQIPGGPELMAWFGHVPDFYDAEIVSLALDRKGPSCQVLVHHWGYTGATDPNGYFVTDRHVMVRFALDDVTDLELNGFNQQNVVMEIVLSRTTANGYRLELVPSLGIDAWIEAREVTISLIPGIPEASGHGPRRGGARAPTEEEQAELGA
jgi:hypothetical protein